MHEHGWCTTLGGLASRFVNVKIGAWRDTPSMDNGMENDTTKTGYETSSNLETNGEFARQGVRCSEYFLGSNFSAGNEMHKRKATFHGQEVTDITASPENFGSGFQIASSFCYLRAQVRIWALSWPQRVAAVSPFLKRTV